MRVRRGWHDVRGAGSELLVVRRVLLMMCYRGENRILGYESSCDSYLGAGLVNLKNLPRSILDCIVNHIVYGNIYQCPLI